MFYSFDSSRVVVAVPEDVAEVMPAVAASPGVALDFPDHFGGVVVGEAGVGLDEGDGWQWRRPVGALPGVSILGPWEVGRWR